MSTRMLAVVLAVLISIFAWAVPAHAADRPQIAVGDSWSYRTTNAWTNEVTSEFTLVVEAVGDEVHLKRLVSGGGSIPIRETPELNIISGVGLNGGGEVVYSPHNRSFKFPLNIGDKEKYESPYVKGGMPGRFVMTTHVVAEEEVKVPAGTFMTVKVDHEGWYTTSNAGKTWTGRIHVIFWYAPAAKRYVRVQYESTDWAGKPLSKIVIEMVAMKVE